MVAGRSLALSGGVGRAFGQTRILSKLLDAHREETGNIER